MSLVGRVSPDKITTNELNCTVFDCTILQRIAQNYLRKWLQSLYSTRLNCIGLCCLVLDYVAATLCCSSLRCVAMCSLLCCLVLLYVALCCSELIKSEPSSCTAGVPHCAHSTAIALAL